MKSYHLIGFLITVIIVIWIIYPWSRENVKENMREHFENSEHNMNNINNINIMNEFETLFNYVLKSRRMSKKYEKRINALKDQLKTQGTVRIEDYKKILADLSEIIKNEYDPDKAYFIIKQENQNTNIEELYKQAKELDKKMSIKNNDPISRQGIGSIKSIESGINLNVKQLDKKDLDLKDKDKIFDDDQHPLMVHLNNGCLTIEANGKYGTQHCEMQNPNQYMIYRKINNMNDLNKHIMDDELKMTDKNNLPRLYPFNLLTPYNNSKTCVQVDSSGLSAQDCRALNTNNDQKWIDNALPRPGCRKSK